MFFNFFFHYKNYFQKQYKKFLFKTYLKYIVIKRYILPGKRDI